MLNKKTLSAEQKKELISKLKTRFEKNMHRHNGTDWEDVLKKLTENDEKLWTLNEMEKSGGEPDVVALGNNSGRFVFCDCSAESPSGRRSLCYDREGLESRKEHKPANTAVDMAAEIGIEILSESEYRQLQILEAFDRKTSSWINTPAEIRKLGGALFCDRRYNQVFVYHNGAESYYAVRGFRGKMTL